jgi:hypothetical protein
MRILLAIPLILLMCASAAAQQRSLLNELKGMESFRSDKLRELKLFVSTKEDVARVMGKECQFVCDHDANWRLRFAYVDNWGMLKDGRHYRPKAESMGKLVHIQFVAERPLMITSADDLPAGVECRMSNGLHESPSIKNRVCTDPGKKISFYMAAETTSDGKYVDGQLLWITFIPDTADYDAIWELIPK